MGIFKRKKANLRGFDSCAHSFEKLKQFCISHIKLYIVDPFFSSSDLGPFLAIPGGRCSGVVGGKRGV